MSVLKRIVTAGGGLALALMAPMITMQAQVIAPGTNPQQPTTNPAPKTIPTTGAQADIRADLPFIREAASANLLEVRLGQVAQTRATDPAVKNFGQRMISDHSSLQQQLTTMTSTNGITVSPTLDAQQQQDISRLQALSGPEFDRAYLELMIQDHQNDVNHFQNEARSNHSAPVQNLITTSQPVLQQHLSLAQQVGRQLNVVVATAPPWRTPTQRAQVGRENLGADRRYIQNVMADNTLEVTLGELAERRAQSPAVRQFAERMLADHKRLEDEWVAMTARNGQPMKPGMGKNHRVKVTQLERLSGNAFDRAYISHVVHDHRGHIDYFEREGRAAHSAQVREMVERALPVWRSHFNQAKQIGGPIGADTAATIRSERMSAR
jgi:putative membrane protein